MNVLDKICDYCGSQCVCTVKKCSNCGAVAKFSKQKEVKEVKVNFHYHRFYKNDLMLQYECDCGMRITDQELKKHEMMLRIKELAGLAGVL